MPLTERRETAQINQTGTPDDALDTSKMSAFIDSIVLARKEVSK